MKLHLARIWLVMLFAALFVACSSYELKEQSVLADDDPISQLLKSYLKSSNTRGYNEDFTVVHVEKKKYTLNAKGNAKNKGTRSLNNEFEVIRADIKFGEKKGYALLTTHPACEGVYYFTNNGSIEDTIQNKALSIMLSAVPMAIGDSIFNGMNNGIVSPGDAFQDLKYVGAGPLLKTKWNQGKPFNNFTPLCYCSNPNMTETPHHCYVGCTNVAVGQVIAYCQRFTGTYYGNKDINFRAITNADVSYNTQSAEAIQIASFLREVAVQIGSKFSCKGTGANVAPAANYLKDMGYTCEFADGNFDMGKVNNCIYTTSGKRCPVIVSGFTKNGDGHTWVIDGVRFKSTSTEYSLNWGWGGVSDGWVDLSVLSLVTSGANKGSDFYISNCAIYITDY